jgi:hypothetical protein
VLGGSTFLAVVGFQFYIRKRTSVQNVRSECKIVGKVPENLI